MEVHAFHHVVFQPGAWKQTWAEAGRITYRATQQQASLEVLKTDADGKIRIRAPKGTRVQISGNAIHLPDGLR